MEQQLSADEAMKLAIAHLGAGRLADAEAICRKVLAVAPRHFEATHVLGLVAHRVGQNEAAHELVSRAIRIDPSRADAWNNLGEIFRALKRADEAVASYHESLKRDPRFAQAYNNLGIVMALTGRHSEAIAAWQHATACNPSLHAAHNNLGNVLQSQGRIDEAIAAHRRAIELRPDDVSTHSNLLRDLLYSETLSPEQLLAEHRAWWERHGKPYAGNVALHGNVRDPERKLRIGLLSPDFRQHSVAYFLEPIVANYDRDRFELICYAEVAEGDEVSERFRQCSDGWQSTVGLSDAMLAERIRGDEIDILIELAGHTADNRIGVCAHRPAPVQASYLGYPFSGGLETIDYRITDDHADPADAGDAMWLERLIRLPRSAWCYRPPADTPDVVDPPAVKNGFVTFGSFNNFAKVTSAVVANWSRILNAVSNSKLMLKSPGLGDVSLRERALKMFTTHGIGAERVTLVDYQSSLIEHFGLYGQVDVALDTFPYSGTTTTCEAMWMGVPVVTLAGEMHLSRVGVSLLSSVGLTELIATNRESYVAAACGLARDIPRMQSLRSELRGRMETSPLRDECMFARDFESALRHMWGTWCVSPASE